MQRPSIAMQRIQFGLHCTARVLTLNVLLHDDKLLRLYFAPSHGMSDQEG
jgi:hypothetical protein